MNIAQHSSIAVASKPEKGVKVLDQLAHLRLFIGYLGSRKQFGWWDCDFLDSTGLRFLETTFPRTAVFSGLRSTSEAACIVHDQALGRVGNFHLFRLPVSLEDRIAGSIGRNDWTLKLEEIKSRDSALNCLRRFAIELLNAPEGPVQIGGERKILTPTSIRELATHYQSAFGQGIRCFPYFAPEKNGS